MSALFIVLCFAYIILTACLRWAAAPVKIAYGIGRRMERLRHRSDLRVMARSIERLTRPGGWPTCGCTPDPVRCGGACAPCPEGHCGQCCECPPDRSKAEAARAVILAALSPADAAEWQAEFDLLDAEHRGEIPAEPVECERRQQS